METIGSRLKTIRKNNNISIKKLAEMTHISSSNISDIENNKISPSANAIIRICSELEISTDFLLLGKESPKLTEGASSIMELYNLLSDENKIVGKYKLKELLKEQQQEEKEIEKIGNL